MQTLLTDIEAFLARHEMAPATFGQLARGDRHLVRQMRAGRFIMPKTEAKIREFMAEYRTPAVAVAAE